MSSSNETSYLQQQAANIRKLRCSTIASIIKIGSILIEVKAKVGHGSYLDWLKAEFKWSERTASNYVTVAELAKSETISDLPIDLVALYNLAAPSTPPAVKQSILARAKNGERITKRKVAAAVSPKRVPKKVAAELFNLKPPDLKLALIEAVQDYEDEHGPIGSLVIVHRDGRVFDVQIAGIDSPAEVWTELTSAGPVYANQSPSGDRYVGHVVVPIDPDSSE